MSKKYLKLLCLPLALLMLCLPLGACVTPSSPESTDEVTGGSLSNEHLNADLNELKIIDNGAVNFELVRPDECHKTLTSNVVELKRIIDEKTKTQIKISTDFINKFDTGFQVKTTSEILVGLTNRSESTQTYESLPENSYTVRKVGSKLVILGKDMNLTALALYKFKEIILDNAEKCSENNLVFSESDSVTVTLDKKFTVPEIIKSGYEYTADTSFLFTCKPYSTEIRVAQGVACDGEFVYFVIRHANDEGCVIYKYRLDDGTLVAESEILQLGHGNDATFDTSMNMLVVSPGQSLGKTLYLIDPDTLTLHRTISISKGAGAITYNAKHDGYAISQGGTTLHFLNSDYSFKSSASRNTVSDYSAQGMGSDDDFIYFPMSAENGNILEVYDWSGNYVTRIQIADKFESESMFELDGKYYISYYKFASNPGAHLYELNLYIHFSGDTSK